MARRGASGDQCAVPVTMSRSTLPYCAQSSGSEVMRVTRARAREPELAEEADVEERTGEVPKIGDPEYLDRFSIEEFGKLNHVTINTKEIRKNLFQHTAFKSRFHVSNFDV